MDAERWQTIQDLFHQALEVPAGERAVFVERAANGDSALALEVTDLLAEDERDPCIPLGVLADAALQNGGPTLPLMACGPYRLTKLLGEGGAAIVYLAEREDLGSFAAIKILRDSWVSAARRERFRLEQKTLAQLAHPAIARFYDADTLADGTPWLAMEYVPDAAPLTEYCRRNHSTVEERLRLLRTVSEAVQYAHALAIIHRDLKPSNLLVAADGSVKLLDFGIAKHLELDGESATVTVLRLMTPAYAAPEQIRGEAVGTYTDVYALGAILYELLTGELPVQQAADPEAAKPSLAGKKLFPKAPWRDLDVICLTALQPDPRRRYASAEAFLRDIDHALRMEPLDAKGESWAARSRKFARRNWRSLGMAAAVFAAIAALVAFYTWRLASARNMALAEAARTQRILRFTLDLFNGGDLAGGPRENLRITELIERGARQVAQLKADPAVQAEMYETLGEVYQKLGKLEEADTLLSRSLAQRQQLFGDKNQSVIEDLVKLGLLRASEARYPEAERLTRRALSLADQTAPPSQIELASATHALGVVLEAEGVYKPAAEIFQRALALRIEANSGAADVASSRFELANCYFYLGRLDEAQRLYSELLPAYRRLYGDRHPMVAEDLINLGAIEQERGHYQGAETYHRQALAMMEEFYGPEHPKTAHSLTLAARALEFQRRYAEASVMLRRALAINEKVYGHMHPAVASTLNELGNIATSTDHYAEAERDFRAMMAIYQEVYRGKHYLIGIAESNLGTVYLHTRKYAQAEELFRGAIGMFTQTLPPKSLNEGIARIKLGRTLLRENRVAEAQTQTQAGYGIVSHLQDPAVSYLKAAERDLSEERKRLAGDRR